MTSVGSSQYREDQPVVRPSASRSLLAAENRRRSGEAAANPPVHWTTHIEPASSSSSSSSSFNQWDYREDGDLTYEYLLSLDSQPAGGAGARLANGKRQASDAEIKRATVAVAYKPAKAREIARAKRRAAAEARARSKAKKKEATTTRSSGSPAADEKDAVDAVDVDQAPGGGGGAADRAGEECDEVCDDEDACVICLEDFVPGERLHRLRSCKCTKVLLYHRECLEKWLKADPSCPQCRSRAI